MGPSLQLFPIPPGLWAEDGGLNKREGFGSLGGGSAMGGCHLRQGDGQCVLGGTGPPSGQRLATGRDSRS